MASRAWPAVRILAEHQDKYQIQWEGDWLPTWEPKANASERLVVDWAQQRRGGGPGCYYAARCIVRERPIHYLVDWCPDECTGERYAPTWVRKKAATRALVAEWNKTKEKKTRTRTTCQKGLAARTTGKRSPSGRHHDDDALPANQEPPPPPQPLPLSPPQSSPPSAHFGLAQQQHQQLLQLQLQLDAAESEDSSSRRNPAPSATPHAMAKLRKLREQRHQASQQTPPASAVETMTEKQGEAGRGAWWDGMPDLSRKSVYGLRKRLFR
ncbi:hypothetical protein BC567DRAFT_212974 [Phyllosticta citribraziliensis]